MRVATALCALLGIAYAQIIHGQTVTVSPSANAASDIESARRIPVPDAMNAQERAEGADKIHEMAARARGAREAALLLYKRNSDHLHEELAKAAADSSLSDQLAVINLLAQSAQVIAALDAASSRTEDVGKPSNADRSQAVSSGKEKPSEALHRGSTPAPIENHTVDVKLAQRPHTAIIEARGTAGSVSTLSKLQEISAIEAKIVKARDHPASDYEHASIPVAPTLTEVELKSVLVKLNGMHPSEADKLRLNSLKRRDEALVAGAKALLKGDLSGARQKWVSEGLMPEVMGDGTKESTAFQNDLRKEAQARLHDYAVIRCRHSTGGTCGILEQLQANSCLLSDCSSHPSAASQSHTPQSAPSGTMLRP